MIGVSVFAHPPLSRPYTVSEGTFEVQQLQPKGINDFGVYLPLDRESLSVQYERDVDDPRVAHSVVLELDAYGTPLRSASPRPIRDHTCPTTTRTPNRTSRRSSSGPTFSEAHWQPRACPRFLWRLLPLIQLRTSPQRPGHAHASRRPPWADRRAARSPNAALRTAYELHRERFPNGPPEAKRPPDRVWSNKPLIEPLIEPQEAVPTVPPASLNSVPTGLKLVDNFRSHQHPRWTNRVSAREGSPSPQRRREPSNSRSAPTNAATKRSNTGRAPLPSSRCPRSRYATLKKRDWAKCGTSSTRWNTKISSC